jgi:sterol desaturase/sphingolipid hydroxylase (fatty acid hydroxylase superfamily)
MINGDIFRNFFIQSDYIVFYFLTILYFFILYFGFALLGNFLAQIFFPKKKIGKPLTSKKIEQKQINTEIKNSIIAILIFGFFGILPKFAYQENWINIVWSFTPIKLILDVIIVFVWNEIHFYSCHWLMHRKWFLKNVHYVHHQSFNSNTFTNYNFHWIEATLLSTVMIIPMLFFNFSFPVLFILPFISIFFNSLAHWNYDVFGNNKFNPFPFSKRHSIHHSTGKGNYGFTLNVLDQIFGTENK